MSYQYLDIDKANKLAEFKAAIEHQNRRSYERYRKITNRSKNKLFSEITKLKRNLENYENQSIELNSNQLELTQTNLC